MPTRSHDDLGRLRRLGFETLAQCLLSAPKDYEDYTSPQSIILPEHQGSKLYLILRLQKISLCDARNKVTASWSQAVWLRIECTDAKGKKISGAVFGNVWPWKNTPTGSVIHVSGEVTLWNGALNLKSPSLVPPAIRGKVSPIYRGKVGQVSGETLRDGVSRAISRMDEAGVYMLAQAGLRESEFQQMTGLSSPSALLASIHAPRSVREGLQAKELAKKLTIETVVRKATAAKGRAPVAKSAIPIDLKFLDDIMRDLPFGLTDDQAIAVKEIVTDLRSAYPMRRLLSGDVGTGKSITFMLPAAAAYEAGAEVAILCPSQLVVEQLAREMREMFPGLPVCEVLAGDALGEGVAIGTTALISAAKKAKKTFHLVITDEQHKFSVDQKAALAAPHSNILDATATAIPRTLALVNFGGMDVSILRKSPVEKKITTRISQPHEWERVTRFIGEVVAKGGQVAVIYPLVEAAPAGADESVDVGDPSSPKKKKAKKEDVELADVMSSVKQWESLFPGRVGVLHGRLGAQEKRSVIEAMHAKHIDVLVSSTVIEVGVTLPSLRAVVVVHPERQGVSQLHQLRGRVARKGGAGFMIMHTTQELEPQTMDRLRLLTRCSDGFALAELDMDMRGFGDVEDDSESQTGSTRMLFFGVSMTHREIADAAKMVGSYPTSGAKVAKKMVV